MVSQTNKLLAYNLSILKSTHSEFIKLSILIIKAKWLHNYLKYYLLRIRIRNKQQKVLPMEKQYHTKHSANDAS